MHALKCVAVATLILATPMLVIGWMAKRDWIRTCAGELHANTNAAAYEARVERCRVLWSVRP